MLCLRSAGKAAKAVKAVGQWHDKLVFCTQEVVRIDKQQALIALGRFKSCVRTSLLLCGGYECQEKEGTFMIAFPQPRAAVEWALTLQLALLRYTWLN